MELTRERGLTENLTFVSAVFCIILYNFLTLFPSIIHYAKATSLSITATYCISLFITGTVLVVVLVWSIQACWRRGHLNHTVYDRGLKSQSVPGVTLWHKAKTDSPVRSHKLSSGAGI